MTHAACLLAIALLASGAVAQEVTVNPSRPSITNSPEIGARGVLEIDAGVGRAKSETWSEPVIAKYAISATTEVRVSHAGGDTTLGLQYAPIADSAALRRAVFTFIDLPARQAGAGLALARVFERWRWDSNLTLTAFRSSAGGAKPAMVAGTLQLTRRITERLSAFADATTDRQRMLGASFLLTPQVAIDVAAQHPRTLLIGISGIVGRFVRRGR